jgi:hypothetical protein
VINPLPLASTPRLFAPNALFRAKLDRLAGCQALLETLRTRARCPAASWPVREL